MDGPYKHNKCGLPRCDTADHWAVYGANNEEVIGMTGFIGEDLARGAAACLNNAYAAGLASASERLNAADELAKASESALIELDPSGAIRRCLDPHDSPSSVVKWKLLKEMTDVIAKWEAVKGKA